MFVRGELLGIVRVKGFANRKQPLLRCHDYQKSACTLLRDDQ